MFFLFRCFGPVEPSSGNAHMILCNLLHLQRIPYFRKIICTLPEDGSTGPKHIAIKRTSSNKMKMKIVA
jgi:hypothetical protein